MALRSSIPGTRLRLPIFRREAGSTKVIVVLDTNVWISALLFRGKPAQAFAKAVAGGQIAVCRRLVEEIEEIATRKFAQKIADVKADLAALLI